MNNREVVETVDVDNKPVTVAVLRPTPIQLKKAQMVYNQTFKEALEAGCIFRIALDKYMREQKLWNDEKEKEFQKLTSIINDGSNKLSKGGIKKSEARELAISMRNAREDLRDLIRERNELDSITCEGTSENTRFNALVSMCVVDNVSGKPVYKDLNDYLVRSDEKMAIDCANRLASMMYGVDSSFEAKLPENKFLQKFGYIDDKLRLVNEDGHLIDEFGRLINEQGRLVNKDGKLIDINGNVIDDKGQPEVEFSPFLDDDGEPIED